MDKNQQLRTIEFLRRLIREAVIAEDFEGFVRKTQGLDYEGSIEDPTFDQDREKADPQRQLARAVKKMWNEEADHNFMDSVIKIHFFKPFAWKSTFPSFMNISRKNEISTLGYFPGTKSIVSHWGPFGVIVKGRTTLAANSMNAILSGYAGNLSNDISDKYKSSGVPKRPSAFFNKPRFESDYSAQDYILDAASFKKDLEGYNEFIVKHWEPVGIILMKDNLLEDIAAAVKVIGKRPWRRMSPSAHVELMGQIVTSLEYNLPIYDKNMNHIPDQAIRQALSGESGAPEAPDVE
jgi:hypothetical protein